MTTARLPHFLADMARARDIVALGQAIGTLTVRRVDATDLYRAGLVQAVSALDNYIHGVVLDRATDMFLGRLSVSGASRTRSVGLAFVSVADIVTAPTTTDRELSARAQIASRIGQETFQKPDDIASALAMVGVTAVWPTVFGSQAGQKRADLGVVVTRRNRIVHQSDSDPLTPGHATPLSAADALDAIATVESTVTAIDSHL